jgi:tRNA A37 N6-isopentenylltransferase MiaA
MKTADFDKFIRDLDHATLDEVKALHQYAQAQARDYATKIGYRPIWKVLARLLSVEVRRYR